MQVFSNNLDNNHVKFNNPLPNCELCPRLCGFRAQNQQQYPHYFNAPVPAFGKLNAENLIVGLAPGLHGANQTGRPFTADYAGDVLYSSLLKYGLAIGDYQKIANDGLQLNNLRITNAVRCVPPENKPIGEEIAMCNQFLRAEISAITNLRTILVLGNISHNATSKALGIRASDAPFKHGASYELGKIKLLCSYHCSRYNINTKRLTQEMFDEVVKNLVN